MLAAGGAFFTCASDASIPITVLYSLAIGTAAWPAWEGGRDEEGNNSTRTRT